MDDTTQDESSDYNSEDDENEFIDDDDDDYYDEDDDYYDQLDRDTQQSSDVEEDDYSEMETQNNEVQVVSSDSDDTQSESSNEELVLDVNDEPNNIRVVQRIPFNNYQIEQEVPVEPNNQQMVPQVHNDENNEQDEVPPKKKIKLDESQKNTAQIDSIDDEDQKCPICLDDWSNAGEHRLCCLKCGHLFGLSCITQWLNVAQSAAARKCPECNTKASKRDIRILYAKRLICVDATEVESLKEELKKSTSDKNLAETELLQYKSREKIYEQQVHSLNYRITELEKKINLSNMLSNTVNVTSKNLFLNKTKLFDVSKNKDCRTIAYNTWHKSLAISSGSFISTIFCDLLTISSKHNIHRGVIRDMAFQRTDPNVLLSVAFDKQIILTDIRENQIKHQYQEDSNLWSCCWSNFNDITFFVGGQKGNISEYDVRYLQNSVNKIICQEDRSPVASLASTPTANSNFGIRLLSCQLNSCFTYCYKDGNYIGNKANIEGPFTALKYNEKNNHILISCRANTNHNYMRQIVCSMDKVNDRINFNSIHSFNSGESQKLLGRPCHMNVKSDSMIVVYNESLKSNIIWSVSTGKELQRIPIDESVVDMCSFENNDTQLAILTSSKLHLYNCNDQYVNSL